MSEQALSYYPIVQTILDLLAIFTFYLMLKMYKKRVRK